MLHYPLLLHPPPILVVISYPDRCLTLISLCHPPPIPHQLHVGELLCQCVGVIADGEHVLLDGWRLGLEGHQLVRDRGGIEGDLDNTLFPLAHQGQPLAEFLEHLVQGFPVSLERNRRRKINNGSNE